MKKNVLQTNRWFKQGGIALFSIMLLLLSSCSKQGIGEDTDAAIKAEQTRLALLQSRYPAADMLNARLMRQDFKCPPEANFATLHGLMVDFHEPHFNNAGLSLAVSPREYDVSEADDVSETIEPEYNDEYSVKSLPRTLGNAIGEFNAELDRIANDAAILEADTPEPVLAATEAAVENMQRNLPATAKELTVDQYKDVQNILVHTRIMVRPMFEFMKIQDWDSSLQGAEAMRFWKKLGKALLRVAAAVVVTAIIVAVPVAAVAIIKGATLKLAAAKAGAALVKGIKLGKGFKMPSPLLTGMGAGIKNAQKNWGKPWKGMQEFVFGIKVKW